MAQRPEVKPFRNMIIGSSGAALYENLNNDPTLQPFDYWEYHWTVNLATDLNKWFRTGVQHISIFTNQDKGDPYFMTGGFLQVDFIPKYENRLFMELNYHRGDFCACEEPTPYSKDGLNFFGMAAGFDWAFSRYLHLDTGMNLSWAGLGNNEWSVFGGYFLGIDFHLFPPKKEKRLPTGRDVKNL